MDALGPWQKILCPPKRISRAVIRRQTFLCKYPCSPWKSIRCLQIKIYLFSSWDQDLALYTYWEWHSRVQGWRDHWVLLYHKEWQLHLPSALYPHKLLVCSSSFSFSPPTNYKWEWDGCKGILTATQEEIWQLLSCLWQFLAVHRVTCNSFLLLFHG